MILYHQDDEFVFVDSEADSATHDDPDATGHCGAARDCPHGRSGERDVPGRELPCLQEQQILRPLPRRRNVQRLPLNKGNGPRDHFPGPF